MSRSEQSSRSSATARLAVLAAHLAAAADSPLNGDGIERLVVLSGSDRTPNLKGTLTVVNESTGQTHKLPVSEHGTVSASDFKKCEQGNGIPYRVLPSPIRNPSNGRLLSSLARVPRRSGHEDHEATTGLRRRMAASLRTSPGANPVTGHGQARPDLRLECIEATTRWIQYVKRLGF
ncbi:hypothetical protein LINPERPRIM_LOCUS42596 [Linum perenne]